MTKHDPTRTDGQSPTGQAALGYAAHGWSVFPIKARGKTPLTRHGFHDATTDPLAIEKWWRRWPDANVGIATGAVSGLVLIDVDAGDGPEVLAALEREFGKLPPTVESLTGGGGSAFVLPSSRRQGLKQRRTARARSRRAGRWRVRRRAT